GVVLLAVLHTTGNKHLSLSSFRCRSGSLGGRGFGCLRSGSLSRAVARRTTAALATGAAGTLATLAAIATRAAGRRRSGSLGGQLLGRHVALVDPDLHADAAEGGLGLVEAVVDVGAQ